MIRTTIGPDWQNHPEWGFITHQVHAGSTGDLTTGAQTVLIYATSAFHFPNAQTAAARFGLQELRPIYFHLTNSANEVLEGRLTSLEGRVGVLMASSGRGTITLALLTLASPSENIVTSPSIYSGAYNLPARTLTRLGLETRFVTDPRHLADWKDLTDESTIVYYDGVIPSPQGDVLDLESLTNPAYDFGVPSVADNAVPTPYLYRPIEQGADTVVQSTTRYLGRNGTALLGAIVDAGCFGFADQAVVAGFLGLNQPDDSYYGVVYAQNFGVGGVLGANLAFISKIRTEGLRDLSLTASPFAVWAVGLGVDTLSLRVAHHVGNVRAVAEHLQSLMGGDVAQTVRWSSLPSSPYYQLVQRCTPKGAGAVLNFDLTDGPEVDRRFTGSLGLLASVANVGDVRSSAIHPASTIYSQLSEAEFAAWGASAEAVRISVDIEGSQDTIADID